MAKVKYGTPVEETYFDGMPELKVNGKGSTATWSYEQGGMIVFTGSGLKEGTHEDIYAGTINAATYLSPDDKTIVTISDLNLKAAKMMQAYEQGGQLGLQFAMLAGDDTFIGSKHDDYMDGGRGNDTFTSKGGEDTFAFDFSGKAQHDVITDFSIEFDDLSLAQQILSTKSLHKGEDTLLRFSGGHDILLEGVQKSDFDAWYSPPDMA